MKRLLALFLSLVLMLGAVVPAYATGDGNFDGGGISRNSRTQHEHKGKKKCEKTLHGFLLSKLRKKKKRSHF